LTFELTLGGGRAKRTLELMPGGHSKAVTKQNVIQYVHLVAHQRLNVESASQTRAFLDGFRDLIPASWVRLFSAYELQKLISGDDSIRGIDVPSLKSSMQYAAGYHPSQPIITWFWEVVDEMTADQQRKLLKFMTSCSRQPLLGFGSLEPAPCVQQIRLPDGMFKEDLEKKAPLPTSSTCMNLLKLPNYRDKELLRKKLLAAIESGAGFELT
jgi:ubiquitin-protein ligase E3 C